MSLKMNVYDGKLFKPYVEILHLLEGMGCMCVCRGGGGGGIALPQEICRGYCLDLEEK